MRVLAATIAGIILTFLCGCGTDISVSSAGEGLENDNLAEVTVHCAPDESESEFVISQKLLDELRKKINKPLQTYFDDKRACETEAFKGDKVDKERLADLRKKALLSAKALAATLEPILLDSGMQKNARLYISGDSEYLRVHARPNITLKLTIKNNAGRVVGYELKGTRKKMKEEVK